MLPAVQRGILGGTFDPPHLAHLFGGEAAYRQLDLDRVTFVPAGAPWQKEGRRVTDGDHRWEMIQLATAGVDYFDADDVELRRPGWTYTIDTLEHFAGDDVTLILGADAARGLPTWQRHEELLSSVRVAVLPRPGVAPDEVDGILDGHDYVWLEAPELAISGTELREWAGRGRSLRFLVPDRVWEYIELHRIYG